MMTNEAEIRSAAVEHGVPAGDGPDREEVRRIAGRYADHIALDEYEMSVVISAALYAVRKPAALAPDAQAGAVGNENPLFEDLTLRQKIIAEALFNVTAGGADDTLMDMAASIACAQAVAVDQAIAASGAAPAGDPNLYRGMPIATDDPGHHCPRCGLDDGGIQDVKEMLDAVIREQDRAAPAGGLPGVEALVDAAETVLRRGSMGVGRYRQIPTVMLDVLQERAAVIRSHLSAAMTGDAVTSHHAKPSTLAPASVEAMAEALWEVDRVKTSPAWSEILVRPKSRWRDEQIEWARKKAVAILACLSALAVTETDAATDTGDAGRNSETFDTIRQWCMDTFGPITPLRIVSRAQEEMDELRADPNRIDRAADVLIVLSRYPGLWDAVHEKMRTNRARKWRLMGDGTGYHVKADGSDSAPTLPASPATAPVDDAPTFSGPLENAWRTYLAAQAATCEPDGGDGDTMSGIARLDAAAEAGWALRRAIRDEVVATAPAQAPAATVDLRPGLEEALRLIGDGREIASGDHETTCAEWGDNAIKALLRKRIAALAATDGGGATDGWRFRRTPAQVYRGAKADGLRAGLSAIEAEQGDASCSAAARVRLDKVHAAIRVRIDDIERAEEDRPALAASSPHDDAPPTSATEV